MIKRILATILCLVMVVSVFASCAKKDENDKGAIINMYLSQEIYNFDPAYAYNNDAALKIVDLLFSTLFTIDENGKLKKELAEDYTYDKNLNTLSITIRQDACWNDGQYISANDVVFAFKRILSPESTSEAACLLFNIKNARTVKNATSDLYIDDIGIYPVGDYEVQITFEDDFTDYESFLYNLANPVLAPLNEQTVSVNQEDWAKKPGTMVCSGPFMIRSISYDSSDKGIVLERNPYYFREKDQALDKSVTPYRIIVDYTKSAEEQYQMYLNGEIFYLGDIALSIRGEVKDAVITDALSTATVYLNQNVYVGKKIRTLDAEKVSEPDEDDEDGVKTITTTHREYYTYYNYMTDEEYAAKYNGAPYVEIPSDEKNPGATTYTLFNTIKEKREEVVNGETVVYIDVYQEWRYKVVTVAEDGTKTESYAVDAPGGIKLFENKDIRNALSLVIDRDAIAKKVVYAKAATALVPYGIFGVDYNRKTDFRENNGGIIGTSANLSAAQALIPSDLDPADFEIELTVRAEDEVHCLIAEEIATAWKSLGFGVIVSKVRAEENDEKGNTGEVATDIMDDAFTEKYEAAEYTAILIDLVASTPSAFTMLAPFANAFAGTEIEMDTTIGSEHLYEIMGHRTGYSNSVYDEKIEAAADPSKSKEERAKLLAEAEKILMEDMPVIPVIFNQDAYLVSKELKKVDSTYFGTRIFTKTKLKNYEDYLPTEQQ